ncbi:Arm DNA-binding domain-containing protein [Seonamhaeicola maritimus]|uniref:Recombinase n=1 Tax=Seonamhaeicola maritimus TaxID=2591822 RepID=A0A5C7GGV8_9FLAO|nr:Arm DNA-binding domain-containing protein [Seonamhaeicola maritimus]TXG36752.1 recombinase [Seonamhaeicola maritimus]
MNTYIKVLFLLAGNRVNNKNKVAIKCRMTYNKQRKEFSTGQFINPKSWLRKEQAIKPDEPDSNLIEAQLSLIKTKLSPAFLFLQVKGSDFTVDDTY